MWSNWSELLGIGFEGLARPAMRIVSSHEFLEAERPDGVRIWRIMITSESRIVVPALLLTPRQFEAQRARPRANREGFPVVVAMAQSGVHHKGQAD